MALSICTDITQQERCVKSLDAVAAQCSFEPTVAGRFITDYCSGLLLVLRSVKAELTRTAPKPGLLGVLAAGCRCLHALVKLPDALPPTTKVNAALGREAALVVTLLTIPHDKLPPAAAGIARLTAKSVLRSRGAQVAADPSSALVLLDWVATVVTQDATPAGNSASVVQAAQLPEGSSDLVLAMLVIDRLGRDAKSVSATPANVLTSVAKWAEAKNASPASDVVHRLVAKEFLARHAKRGVGEHGAVSPAVVRAEPSPSVTTATQPLDAVAMLVAASFRAAGVDAAADTPLSVHDVTLILGAAKLKLEAQSEEVAQALADTVARREALQASLEDAYTELRVLEARLVTPSGDENNVAPLLRQLERNMARTSAATPRISVSGGFAKHTPRFEAGSSRPPQRYDPGTHFYRSDFDGDEGLSSPVEPPE